MRIKIQRWICTLLTLTMLLSVGAFNVVVAETADTVTTYDKAFELLSYLGIYDEDMEIDRIDKEKTISRGEFAIRFSRLINAVDLNMQALYYVDVPESHYAYKEITNLTELGYLSGIGDKKFAPEESIRQADAAKLLLKGLGLLEVINGGYTNEGFISDAMYEAEISVTGEYMTFGQMTLMLYNALLADCYSMSGVKGDNVTYDRIEGESLLYKTRKLRYIKNELLTAANGTSIYDKESGAKEVIIGDVKYYTEDRDFSDFLGRYVDFVYSEDDAPELVWAILTGTDTKLLVTVGDKGGYDAGKNQIWYTKNDKKRYVNISASPAVVYNGRPIYTDVSQVLSVPNTRLTLLSSQKNSNYDIILAESHLNLQVRSKDDDEYIVRDSFSGESICLEESEYDNLLIEDLNGNEITWADIQEYDILSIFKTKDGGYVRVVVSNNMINGTVDRVNGDGTVVIGDSTYKPYDDSVSSGIVLGASGIYYLDCFGYIAAVNTSMKSANDFVGFALTGVCYTEADDTGLVLKILSENGNIEKFFVKDKLNINGIKFKDMEAAMSELSENGIFKPQIMLCKKNESGDLIRIDTASPDDGGVHPLTVNRELKKDLNSIEQAMYNPHQKSIGLTMLTNSDTVIFSVPENIGSDLSKCFVATLRQWDDYRGAVSYRTTAEDTFYEEYIVTRQITYATTAQNHPIVMVDHMMMAVDEEGEVVTRLVVARAGKLQEFTVDENCDIEYYNLKCGDVIRLATTASNDSKVESVSIVSRVGDTTAVGSSLRETPYSERTISCYAHDKKGNALKVGWDSGEDFDEIIQLSDTTPIAVYDSVNDKVYFGTIDDIDTYKSGNTPSKLIVQSSKGLLQYIMVQR